MPIEMTLLLTDVVDSTARNRLVGDAVMSKVWAAHDRHSRQLIRLWQGREIGRSDGFLILFDEPTSAIGFAYDYHQALAGLVVALRARVGIHCGPVDLRPNSEQDIALGAPQLEVDGLALPMAARLMAGASAGQTLISATCVRALEPTVRSGWLNIDRPDGAWTSLAGVETGRPSFPIALRLVSHGHWRFKGIESPEEVFQAGSDDDDFAPPLDSPKAYRVQPMNGAWRPVREVPHHLPAEVDRFVGRNDVLRAIAERFDEGARLVSLLGAGGIGKTRASVRYARRWLGDFEGGAWFCDLSAATSLDGVVYAVAQAMDIPMDRTDPVELIGAAIDGRGTCLVILDNFEQVTAHALHTLGAWLRRAAQARFLVTSREVLGLAGECALYVEPLERSEAEDLLRDRMFAAGADPVLSDADQAAFGPLIDLLDRLPLAIELAASRASLMSPEEMLARMNERFKLLIRQRGAQHRQSALRTTLDWSWDLLAPGEQAALAQCSVFEGGFTLVAAESVLELASSPPSVADAVQALVEKSLLRRAPGHRFEMLRSVHDYAGERLLAFGEETRQAAQGRHWHYFGSLDEQSAISDRCVEAENLVAACRRAIAAADLSMASNALVLSWAALNLTGPFNVAIQLAESLYRVAHPHAMEVAITAMWVSGSARYLAGDVASAQRDLEAAQWTGASPVSRARVFAALGQLERSLGNLARAEDLLGSGLDEAIETGDAGLISRAYNASGVLRLAQGRFSDARECFVTGLAVARSAGDRKQQAALLGNIGVVDRKTGHDDSAVRHYEDALLLAQQIGDRRFEGNMRSNLGLFHLQTGEPELALQELEAALVIARSAGLARLAANACCNLGLALESIGRNEDALQRHWEAVRFAEGLRDAHLVGHFSIYCGRLLVRMGRSGEAQRWLEDAAALLGTSAEIPLRGLLACARAEWAASVADDSQAHHWLGLAVRAAEESSSPSKSELAEELRRVRAAISSR